MKIGILSRSRTLYSTDRLVEAGRIRGHQVQVIDTLQLARSLGITSPHFRSSYERALPTVDAIIPRIGASITRYGVAVVRDYEDKGIVTTAPSRGISQSRNKLQSVQLMQKAQLPIPRSALISTLDELPPIVESVGGFPVVIKISKGTQGRGVILVPNLSTARAVLSIFFRHGQRPILIQEFIAEADGQDMRLLVVGRRCVAAMERSAPKGEFRANLHRGATPAPVIPDTQTKQLALQATALHRLGVAGVDIIPSRRGPLLLEVNSSPGLEGIENTTDVDVAGEIVQYLERESLKKDRLQPKSGR